MYLPNYLSRVKFIKKASVNVYQQSLNTVIKSLLDTFHVFRFAKCNAKGIKEISYRNNRINYNLKSLRFLYTNFKKLDPNNLFLNAFFFIFNEQKIKKVINSDAIHLFNAIKFISMLGTINHHDFLALKVEEQEKIKQLLNDLIKYELLKYDSQVYQDFLAIQQITKNTYSQNKWQVEQKNEHPELTEQINIWKHAQISLEFIKKILINKYHQGLDDEIETNTFINKVIEYIFVKLEADKFLNNKVKTKPLLFQFYEYNEISELGILLLDDVIESFKNYHNEKNSKILSVLTETGGKIRLSDEPPMTWYQWVNLIISYLFILFWAVVILYPTFLFVKQAFNGYNTNIPDFSQFYFSVKGFQLLFASGSLYLTWLEHSLLISFFTMIFTVFFCALTSYALSRFRYKGKRAYFIAFLIIQLFPTFTGVIVYYIFVSILRNLGMPPWVSLIIIYTGGFVVSYTLILKSYMDSISHEIDEAAIIDGCGYSAVFFRMIIPLIMPMICLVAVWSFTLPFGDVIFPTIILTSETDYTVAQGLMTYINPTSDPMSLSFIKFVDGGIIIAVPICIVFLVFQKFLVSGMSLGGVKG